MREEGGRKGERKRGRGSMEVRGRGREGERGGRRVGEVGYEGMMTGGAILTLDLFLDGFLRIQPALSTQNKQNNNE